MAKVEGEPLKPPSTSPSPVQVSWLARTIQWLGKKDLIDLPPAPKTSKVSQEVLTKPKRPPSEAENFQYNYAFILDTSSQDLEKLTVHDGKLIVALDKPDPDRAKQLIQQTVRQTQKQLINAPHVEVALQALDQLNRHLRLHLPECIEKDPRSPLRILSEAHGKTSPEAQAKRKELEARVQKAALVLSESASGINKAQLITSSSRVIAVQKAEHEERMGKITAVMRGKPDTEGPEYAAIGGVNELIAANLSILLEGRPAIPLAMRRAETTIHAFVKNKGNFADNWETAENKQAFLESFPQRPTQGLILGQLALGGLDCSGENILLDDENNPIAIDFGMCLGYDPLDVNANLCGVYLDWPAMDATLSQEDLDYWKSLDIDATMEVLHTAIKAQYSDKMKETEMREVIEGNLRHLYARLITLQEGMRGGLTSLRELMALFLPPFTMDEHLSMMNATDDVEPSDVSSYKKYANAHIKSKGFKKAWAEAKGDTSRFKELIQQEISSIQKESLYSEYERIWYRNAQFDVSLTPIGEDV